MRPQDRRQVDGRKKAQKAQKNLLLELFVPFCGYFIFLLAAAAGLSAFATPARAGDNALDASLDAAEENLAFDFFDGLIETQLGGSVDLELYTIDQRPPGLLFADPGDDALFRPRLTLNGDLFAGEHFYGFLKFRWDDGFDPASRGSGEARLDEYFLRASAADGAFNFQAGKFATVFGNWAGQPRHEPWDNPFITAPLPYENVTSVVDHAAAPGPAALTGRTGMPNNLRTWVPVIWGPAYTTGLAAFGAVDKFNYAVEIKSRAPSSRPSTWEDWDFSNPTVAGRLGYAPNAAWNLGTSASLGPYLSDLAASTLPPGAGLGDFDQTNIGVDLRFARHRFELWSEVIYSRFEVPNAGDQPEAWSYYIEGRYKLTPNVFAALRWNQQFFRDLDTPAGAVNWDNDIYRVDAALTWRAARHLQFKLQYSYTRQDAGIQNGENLVAGQMTLRF